jgi:hypothetical protein
MKTPVAIIAVRMKPLPRGHCFAHLRALIRREPSWSGRGEKLAALLRDEMSASSGAEIPAK